MPYMYRSTLQLKYRILVLRILLFYASMWSICWAVLFHIYKSKSNLFQDFPCWLLRSQIEQFVQGLFTLNQDLPKFKLNLRDFLINIKEFAGEDDVELFQEDRDSEIQSRLQAERAKAMQVPGLLKPSEREDDEEL